MKKRFVYTVGIDEVGRGPLAGPVAVGAVLIDKKHQKQVARLFPVVKDSKKLSHKKRVEWLAKIKGAEEKGFLVSAVAFVSSSEIDRAGLSKAIRKALQRALVGVRGKMKVNSPDSVLVLLDGGLYAPERYKNQKTIIKGDEKELSIALASIVAKVTRDALMVKLGKKFPQYGFEKHKGYGTHLHYNMIKKHGLTPHHRKSFLKHLVRA
ncbi:MAG: ribonuclease HII [Candidatus Pacebacteria bacterium]|nr:ribonuclease HII [Candidatus Paceibacterota bacterium]